MNPSFVPTSTSLNLTFAPGLVEVLSQQRPWLVVLSARRPRPSGERLGFKGRALRGFQVQLVRHRPLAHVRAELREDE